MDRLAVCVRLARGHGLDRSGGDLWSDVWDANSFTCFSGVANMPMVFLFPSIIIGPHKAWEAFGSTLIEVDAGRYRAIRELSLLGFGKLLLVVF